jgi:phage gpG-like protein
LAELSEKVQRLEKRMEAMSRVVRTALGEAEMGFMCGRCGQFSKMKYDQTEGLGM